MWDAERHTGTSRLTHSSLFGVISLRLSDRYHVVRLVCKANPVIVCLDAVVTCAFLFLFGVTNPPEQSAFRVARLDKWINPVREQVQIQKFEPVPSFPVLAVVLTPDSVAHSSLP